MDKANNRKLLFNDACEKRRGHVWAFIKNKKKKEKNIMANGDTKKQRLGRGRAGG